MVGMREWNVLCFSFAVVWTPRTQYLIPRQTLSPTLCTEAGLLLRPLLFCPEYVSKLMMDAQQTLNSRALLPDGMSQR
jgi:hypothetical protein